MSSNRSLGGARQRRAGEQAPMVAQRSNTSISSQQIFAKQQMQSQPQQSTGQRVQRQPQQQQPQQTQNFNQDGMEQGVPGKLSIPKAFTLVTLRLGRLEQYIQQIQEEGGLNQYADTTSENNQVFDSVIKNVLTRLDDLEKNLKQIQNTPSLKEEEDKFLPELKINVDKLDKDLRETKDLLMILMMKHEKFTLETNDKFQNLNDILLQMNDEEMEEIEENEEEYLSENVNIVIENDKTDNNSLENECENISAINLKEIIENELSNELLA
jgi:hypothetical protein